VVVAASTRPPIIAVSGPPPALVNAAEEIWQFFSAIVRSS
jgi:hypothetical protein